MTTLLILLLQAAAPATVAIPTHVRRPCDVSVEPGEVVVCGKAQDDQYRLKPIPLPAGMKKPIDAPGIDFDIGQVHGNIYTASEASGNGQMDKRIMIGLKLPF